MQRQNDNWNPSAFRPPKSAPRTHLQESEHVRPEITGCPRCQTPPAVYKTIPKRTIITLTGSRQIRETQTCCRNPECPGRTEDDQTGKKYPLVFTSAKVRALVLPRMKYGLDVILEVGRRFKTDPKPGRLIQNEIERQYGLKIPLATLYRQRDYYEALCMGAMAEHQAAIREQLHQQLTFILILDATEQKGSMKLYRAIDALSGVCLGTRLLPVKNKSQLLDWRLQLYHTYGTPAYLVTDREDTLQTDPTQEPAIPQQICWSHLLKHIWKIFFTPWWQQATKFLRQTRYRRQIQALLQQLDQTPTETQSSGQAAVRELLQVFLTRLPGRSTFHEPVHDRLVLFSDALTLVNTWLAALKGVKRDEYADSTLFHVYRQHQTQISPPQWAQWVQEGLPNQDSSIQVLYQLQQSLQDMCKQKRFKALLREFKVGADEFLTLRSWLLEAQLRRIEENKVRASSPLLPAEERFYTQLHQRSSELQEQLRGIPRKRHAWQWRDPEPEDSFPVKAAQTLQRILTRWSRKQTYGERFRKAAAVLGRHFDGLLVFLQHIAIPVTNQRIETDNGRLKRLWRRSSGGQDRGYGVDYHGESDSITLNFHDSPFTASPLELLGFTREELAVWIQTCPLNRFHTARQAMVAARQPRRNVLRARWWGLKTVFQSRTFDFLKHGKDLFQAYLEGEST